jgi:hypothetical protein
MKVLNLSMVTLPLVADIVTIQNTPRAKRSIFGELNRIYSKHIHGVKNCLVSNITTEEGITDDQIIFTVTITLLPHQIIFFPAEYKDYILNESIFENMQIYEDEDLIRYIEYP